MCKIMAWYCIWATIFTCRLYAMRFEVLTPMICTYPLIVSRQTSKHATQPIQHSLLLSRSSIALGARLANANTDITAIGSNNTALRRQTSAVAASHDIFRCQDRHCRVDSRKDEAEVFGGRAGSAAGSREVHVQVDVARQVWRRAACEYGRGELSGDLGVDGAVGRSASVPGGGRAGYSRESNAGDACSRRYIISREILRSYERFHVPSFTASVAAPTVPEARTTIPKFEPTLGPVTAISGLPPKNFGDSVWIPYLMAVTGYELTYCVCHPSVLAGRSLVRETHVQPGV